MSSFVKMVFGTVPGTVPGRILPFFYDESWCAGHRLATVGNWVVLRFIRDVASHLGCTSPFHNCTVSVHVKVVAHF